MASALLMDNRQMYLTAIYLLVIAVLFILYGLILAHIYTYVSKKRKPDYGGFSFEQDFGTARHYDAIESNRGVERCTDSQPNDCEQRPAIHNQHISNLTRWKTKDIFHEYYMEHDILQVMCSDNKRNWKQDILSKKVLLNRTVTSNFISPTSHRVCVVFPVHRTTSTPEEDHSKAEGTDNSANGCPDTETNSSSVNTTKKDRENSNHRAHGTTKKSTDKENCTGDGQNQETSQTRNYDPGIITCDSSNNIENVANCDTVSEVCTSAADANCTDDNGVGKEISCREAGNEQESGILTKPNREEFDKEDASFSKTYFQTESKTTPRILEQSHMKDIHKQGTVGPDVVDAELSVVRTGLRALADGPVAPIPAPDVKGKISPLPPNDDVKRQGDDTSSQDDSCTENYTDWGTPHQEQQQYWSIVLYTVRSPSQHREQDSRYQPPWPLSQIGVPGGNDQPSVPRSHQGVPGNKDPPSGPDFLGYKDPPSGPLSHQGVPGCKAPPSGPYVPGGNDQPSEPHSHQGVPDCKEPSSSPLSQQGVPGCKDPPSGSDVHGGKNQPLGPLSHQGVPGCKDSPSGPDVLSYKDPPSGPLSYNGVPGCKDPPSGPDVHGGNEQQTGPLLHQGVPGCKDPPSGPEVPGSKDQPSGPLSHQGVPCCKDPPSGPLLHQGVPCCKDSPSGPLLHQGVPGCKDPPSWPDVPGGNGEPSGPLSHQGVPGCKNLSSGPLSRQGVPGNKDPPSGPLSQQGVPDCKDPPSGPDVLGCKAPPSGPYVPGCNDQPSEPHSHQGVPDCKELSLGPLSQQGVPGCKDPPSGSDVHGGKNQPLGPRSHQGIPGCKDPPSGPDVLSYKDPPSGPLSYHGVPGCKDPPSGPDVPGGNEQPPGPLSHHGVPGCKDPPSGPEVPGSKDQPSGPLSHQGVPGCKDSPSGPPSHQGVPGCKYPPSWPDVPGGNEQPPGPLSHQGVPGCKDPPSEPEVPGRKYQPSGPLSHQGVPGCKDSPSGPLSQQGVPGCKDPRSGPELPGDKDQPSGPLSHQGVSGCKVPSSGPDVACYKDPPSGPDVPGGNDQPSEPLSHQGVSGCKDSTPGHLVQQDVHVRNDQQPSIPLEQHPAGRQPPESLLQMCVPDDHDERPIQVDPRPVRHNLSSTIRINDLLTEGPSSWNENLQSPYGSLEGDLMDGEYCTLHEENRQVPITNPYLEYEIPPDLIRGPSPFIRLNEHSRLDPTLLTPHQDQEVLQQGRQQRPRIEENTSPANQRRLRRVLPPMNQDYRDNTQMGPVISIRNSKDNWMNMTVFASRVTRSLQSGTIDEMYYLDGHRMCMVCRNGPVDAQLQPCGHIIYCHVCVASQPSCGECGHLVEDFIII